MTAQTRWQVSKLFKAALNKRREMPEESKGDIARWLFSEGMAVARAELEATIEQLRSELDGEKAAALNYRADAIKAEKQRDELLAALGSVIDCRRMEFLARNKYELKYLPIYADQPDPTYIVKWVWEVRDQHGASVAEAHEWLYQAIDKAEVAAIASVKSDHFRDAAKMVEGGAA